MTEHLFGTHLIPVQRGHERRWYPLNKIDEVVLVGGSTRMPMVVEFVKKHTNGKEPNKGVNPDEVVRLAPPFRVALPGEVKDVCFWM